MAVTPLYGKVVPAFWEKVYQEGWSHAARDLALYLITASTSRLGVYTRAIDEMERAVFRKVDEVEQFQLQCMGNAPAMQSQCREALAELVERGFCEYDMRTERLWITHYLKYNKPRTGTGYEGVVKDFEELPSWCPFRTQVADKLIQFIKLTPERAERVCNAAALQLQCNYIAVASSQSQSLRLRLSESKDLEPRGKDPVREKGNRSARADAPKPIDDQALATVTEVFGYLKAVLGENCLPKKSGKLTQMAKTVLCRLEETDATPSDAKLVFEWVASTWPNTGREGNMVASTIFRPTKWSGYLASARRWHNSGRTNHAQNGRHPQGLGQAGGLGGGNGREAAGSGDPLGREGPYIPPLGKNPSAGQLAEHRLLTLKREAWLRERAATESGPDSRVIDGELETGT